MSDPKPEKASNVPETLPRWRSWGLDADPMMNNPYLIRDPSAIDPNAPECPGRSPKDGLIGKKW
jgi:hypothetical protein